MHTEWELLSLVPNAPLAHVLLDLLSGEGVACRLDSDTSLLGEGRACRVMVERAQLHRARWVLSQRQISEEELALLATGSLAASERGSG